MKVFFENIVLKRQRQICCVGIFLINRNEWRISVVRTKIHNNEINIITTVENLKELKEVEDVLIPNIPVILHIDGWGVLIKDNGIENSAIPIDNKEFFLKEYTKSDQKGMYFSIIRNDVFKNIIDFFKAASLNIIGLSMGPFDVALLASFFEAGKEIKAGKWKITLNNNCINFLVAEDLEPKLSYNIGGETITSEILPLYAAIVAFFSGERESNDLIVKSRDEFIYNCFIKYFIISSLSALLVFLSLNYFIWDTLKDRNAELTYEVASNNHFLSQLIEKEKDIKMKENLVVQYIGTNSKTHYSWYADKLGSTLPSGIHLTLIDIQPIIKKQKPGIAIEYSDRIIEVEGDAGNMSEISEWVNAIDRGKWAKQVELISFVTENNRTTGHFKLQITY